VSRVLPNLREHIRREPTARELVPTFHVIELADDDLLPSQAWLRGWWWFDYRNPITALEPEHEGDCLPSRARGPFKTERRCIQAAQAYIAGSASAARPTDPLDSAGDC
jgi:hypothetical protein